MEIAKKSLILRRYGNPTGRLTFKDKKVSAMSTNGILEVKALDVSYGESKVLFNISFKVGSNEVVSIVGRNGAGKTTLLKTIGGFLKPVSGSITFKDKNTYGLPSFTVAKMGLKYIPQDKIVFSDLTVRENFELSSYATRDYDLDKVFNYFPKMKILLDRKAGYLSGGERQMLMIARALLGKPAVSSSRTDSPAHARRQSPPYRTRLMPCSTL